jgi:GNAT superfamily N-acetyltransferase
MNPLTVHHLGELHQLCTVALRDEIDLPTVVRLLEAEPAAGQPYQLGYWVEQRLVGALLGAVRERQGAPFGGVRLLVVHPAWRRQGIATRLLHALEERCVAAGITTLQIGGIAPNYLYPGLDVRDTPAFCLFERMGYTRVGEAVNMHVDLLAHPWAVMLAQAPIAAGWQIRRAHAHEAAAVVAWVQAHWSASWAWEAQHAFTAAEPTIFLALCDGQIGGFACHSVSGLPGTFGPTGTLPTLQGQGLGRALLYVCLADLHALGYAHCEIGWVGPISFYARAAHATISRVYWQLHKTCRA